MSTGKLGSCNFQHREGLRSLFMKDRNNEGKRINHFIFGKTDRPYPSSEDIPVATQFMA